MTTTTKKIRASQIRPGHVIQGRPVESVSSQAFYGAPGTTPWTQVTATFAASDDPEAPYAATYGSSQWVEVAR